MYKVSRKGMYRLKKGGRASFFDASNDEEAMQKAMHMMPDDREVAAQDSGEQSSDEQPLANLATSSGKHESPADDADSEEAISDTND